jgi:hypothetical protein
MSLLGLAMLPVAVIGAAQAAFARASLRPFRLLTTTPRVPIQAAPAGARVHIRGLIAAGEQGLILTPFTGRRAVWARIAVEEREGKSGWRQILLAEEGRVFFVDDGSGERARVDPASAYVLAERETVAESGFLRDMPVEIEAFLAMRGLTSKTDFGFNKAMRCVETVLVEGARIAAIGTSERRAGPVVTSGYRSVASTELVLSTSTRPSTELVLATEGAARQRREWLHFLFATACAAMGVIGAVVALILR